MRFLYAFFLFITYIFPNTDDFNSLSIELNRYKKEEYEIKEKKYSSEIENIKKFIANKTPQNCINLLDDISSKLYNIVKFNFFFALHLDQIPDEAIISMLIKKFEKIIINSTSSFTGFKSLLMPFYQKTVFLIAIFQNDYGLHEEFSDIIYPVLKQNDTLFLLGSILGKPIFFYLFFCKNFPVCIKNKISHLTEKIKKPSEYRKATIFFLKIKPFFQEYLPQKNDTWTINQHIIMPFHIACTEAYKSFLAEKYKDLNSKN